VGYKGLLQNFLDILTLNRFIVFCVLFDVFNCVLGMQLIALQTTHYEKDNCNVFGQKYILASHPTASNLCSVINKNLQDYIYIDYIILYIFIIQG